MTDRLLPQVELASILKFLSFVNVSPQEAVAQLVQNEVDAGATKIFVAIYPNELVVVGNGHGMNPDMLPEDLEKFNNFIQQAKAGTLQKGADVRTVLSDASRHCFYYMMNAIAFSQKAVDKDKDEKGPPKEGKEPPSIVTGMRGVGFWGYLLFANKIRVISKPNQELATGYYGHEVDEDDIQVYQLFGPTRERIYDYHDAGYPPPEPVDQKVLDPFRNVLPHGTRVEVEEFLPDKIRYLMPGVLGDYFTNLFGEMVRRGQFELVIWDHITKPAIKEKGRAIYIRPVQYPGIPVLERELKGWQDKPFFVRLYYGGGKGTSSPEILRKGIAVGPLTSLEEFKGHPWDQLVGTVEVPSYSQAIEQQIWDAQKKVLVPSRARSFLASRLLSLVSQINAGIDDIKSRRSEQEEIEMGATVSDAVALATSEIPVFKEMTVPGGKTHPGPKGRKRKDTDTTDVDKPEPRKPVDIEAVVFDESDAVSFGGVSIELLQDDEVIEILETKENDSIHFKGHAAGTYRIQMVVPEGMHPKGKTWFDFITTQTNPGFRAVFHLLTGASKSPTDKPIRGKIAFLLRPTPTTRGLWELHLDQTPPTIVINTAAEPYRRARDSRDVSRYHSYLVNTVASSVVDGRIKGTNSYLLNNEALLAAHLYPHLSRLLGENLRKKARAASRRK